jgi:hypothetical protein
MSDGCNFREIASWRVERELRAYLDRGILAGGFAMEDTAEHLVRNVLPEVPIRQWVLSFPRRVRFLAARHPALASRLLDLFTRAVFTWQRRQGVKSRLVCKSDSR